MRFPVFILLCSVAAICSGLVPAQECNPLAPGPGISPMRALYVQDQRDRGVKLGDDGSQGNVKEPKDASKVQVQCDAARQKKVRGMLEHGEVKTAQDFHDASFIFQHGQTPEEYLLVHILAMEAVALGDTGSRWIAAATLDRYLQSIGQKQVFGTQYLDEKYAYYLQHRHDADML